MVERMDFSLQALCLRMQTSSALDAVAAIRAAPLLRNGRQALQFERIAAHFGFAPASEVAPLPRRLRGVGENIVSLMLIAAHNPAAVHADLLVGLRPAVFISRRRLENRYRRALRESP